MPRVRLDGGVIGTTNNPSTTSAGGMWSFVEHQKYTRSAGWPAASNPINSVNAIVAMIGGGAGATGGTSSVNFGAGGAGGVLRYANSNILYGSTNQSYTVTIGAGGAGVLSGTAGSGSNSTFSASSVVATGGIGNTSSSAVGGSNADYVGGTGSGSFGSGGGAGAGGNGITSTGVGGPGANIAISGAFTSYGGGGGGVSNGSGAAGGAGGGGAYHANGAFGTGGGAGGTNSSGVAKNGGSGVVIINYPAPQQYTGGTVTNVNNLAGSNIIHTFTSSGTLTALATPIDTYFPQTTLLLHGDGTNGANNTVFLDGSTNNLTITTNGKPLQGTFSPFSQTGWSNYFNGSTDYITLPNNMTVVGSNAYTLEGWFFPTTVSASEIPLVKLYNATQTIELRIVSSKIQGRINGSATIVGGDTTLTPNQWYHFALVKPSSGTSTAVLYINGVAESTTASDTTTYTAFTTPRIGANQTPNLYFTGWASNVRFINGSAQYTGNFTPSLTPLTAVTNTLFLTCQDNRFKENSTNAYTLTLSGTPSVQAFSPFSPSSAYSNTAVGGSIKFNGSPDALLLPTSTNVAISASQDFTLECWVNIPTASLAPSVHQNVGNSRIIAFFLSDVALNTIYTILGDANYPSASNSSALRATSDLTPNVWNHVAFVRSGSTITIYINGVAAGTASNSFATNTTQIVGAIAQGGAPNFYFFNGHISDLRLLKGTALYTSNFTPPTAPSTAITNTQLLLSATNAGIIDQTAKNDITTYGSAAISTTQSKFGGTSIYFNGTTDYLALPVSNFLPAVNTYTIEFWMYPLAYPGSTNNVSLYNVTNAFTGAYGSLFVQLYGSGNIRMEVRPNTGGTNVQVTTSGTVSLNTWSHIAVVVNAGAATIYINGSSSATGTVVVMDGTQTFSAIGALNNTTASNFYNGYLDDIRITKGIARYTSSFIPPTSAFLNQ